MKIRRILATAVAAAVTTPVVFLSAAPAFADTKPSTASTRQAEPTYAELKAAVDKARARVGELRKQREALVTELEGMKLDQAVRAEADAAAKAAEAAGAAVKDAAAKLAEAETALEAAAPEEREAAELAVADARKAAEEATAEKTVADARHKKATEPVTAFDDARVALSRRILLLDTDLIPARAALDAAEEALEEFESGPDCDEDDAVQVTIAGPKRITAGTSGLFSLRVTNTTDRTLETVEAYAAALNLTAVGGEDGEDGEGAFLDGFLGLEWSSAAHPGWQKLSAEAEDSILIGTLVEGGRADLKLRLTVSAETPAGKGVAFAVGAYENKDGSCGTSQEYATAHFDILAAGTDEPEQKPETKPETKPEPEPSETTATPATGDGGTTPMGGSSVTPVTGGTLAATGANDTLPLGLAAAGAVALGAGALVLTRRRGARADA